ncbi:sensor domain-containing diguanylate cyclase [Anaerobiospirillum succiniciproducens]|uniref:sensor domain-containing diguanylate cyclase n=1 Tax=Anaerobiospirillum succiniciproducens TaxID=13335 RepID=UPI00235353DE|nr:sensor domain-containing diguanylate cyclase [Anaerobiospirillum succiniciproducens]MCI6863513.1 sensor domain-containing diguanylate cyclase [Anaerobiospirillum succiniciproducens]
MIKKNPNNTQVPDLNERDDVPRVDCSLQNGTALQSGNDTTSDKAVRLAIDSQNPSSITIKAPAQAIHDHCCASSSSANTSNSSCASSSSTSCASASSSSCENNAAHACKSSSSTDADSCAAGVCDQASLVEVIKPYDYAHSSVYGTNKPLTSLLDSKASINVEPIVEQLVDTCPLYDEDITSNTTAPAVLQSDINCLSDLINGLGDNSGITASIGIANENPDSSSVYHTVQTALNARENENGILSEKRMRALEKAKRFSSTKDKRTSRDSKNKDKDNNAESEDTAASSSASSKKCLETGMKAQYSFDRNITFPGFGIYDIRKRGFFLDKHAVTLLDLDPSFISTWVSPRSVLRILGREVTHKIFAYTRTLRDTNKEFINPCLAHGNNVCPYTEDNPEYSTSGGVDDLTVEDLAGGPAAKPIIDDPNELLHAIGCPVHEIRQIKARSESIATSLIDAISEPVDTSNSAKNSNTQSNANIFDTLFHNGPYENMPSIEHKSTENNSVYGTNFVTGYHAKINYTSNDALPVNFDSVASNMQYSALTSKNLNSKQTNNKPKSNLGFRFGLFGVTPRPSKAQDPTAIMPETKCTEVAKSHLELTHSNGNLYRRYDSVYLPGEHSRDRASFAVFLTHGKDAGSKIYIKLNALFEGECLSHITMTFTRVASYLFAMLPHVAAESASFDWLTSTGECVFGSNYYSMLGYKPDDPRAKAIRYNWYRTVVHPDDKEVLKKQSRLVLSEAHGDNFEFLYRSRCRNGSYIWTKSIGTVIARNEQKLATRILGINININRVIEGYENLQSKVFTDILTGLKNRTYLTTHLPEIIANTRGQLSVIFTDVTALKAYNDYLGHTVGDRLLCSAAILINSVIDIPSELIRISGDEIVCLLPDCNEEQAASVVNKLDAAVKEYNINAPVRMPVFFSCGANTTDLSEFTNKELSKSDLHSAMEKIHLAIQEADKIMQVNKKAAHEEHYNLVKAYIEQSLKQKIEFNDKRLFA